MATVLEKLPEIFTNQRMTKTEYIKHHSEVYNHCVTRLGSNPSGFGGEILYQDLVNSVTDFQNSLLARAYDLTNPEDILQFFTIEWEKYQKGVNLLNKICKYLNDHFVQKAVDEKRTDIFTVDMVCKIIWKDNLFKKYHQQVIESVLDLVKNERNGGQPATTLISGIVDCCIKCGIDQNTRDETLEVYEKELFTPYLENTKNWYIQKSFEFLKENSMLEYMTKVDMWLLDEKRRVELCLHQSSLQIVLKTCEDVLIKNHIQQFHEEFQKLLSDEKIEDLKLLYSLVSRIPNCLDEFKEIFQAHVIKIGLESLERTVEESMEDCKVYINTILEVYCKFENMIDYSFNKEKGFIRCLDIACMKFINDNAITKKANSSHKTSELLAKYCDFLLKKGNINLEESDIEQKFDQTMTIFKYIEDKDAFELHYKKFLANRLVKHTSASDDNEAAMISRLRQSCGFEYTNKLHTMFKDYGVSKDLNEDFKQQVTSIPLDFQVQVLTTSSWPFQSKSTYFCSLPVEIEQCISKFTAFYLNKHPSKKLHWLNQLGTGEVTTNCFRNKYTFQVSTLQMAILMQFNDQSTLNLIQLLESTQISKEFLIQVLKTLTKIKILKVDNQNNNSNDDELNENSIISVNSGFKHKKLRININVPLKTEQKKEEKISEQTIIKGRGYQIEATIVRTMKARKVLKHKDLMTEVIGQLGAKFKPDVKQIKQKIQGLIDKDYMKREDMSTYSYVA